MAGTRLISNFEYASSLREGAFTDSEAPFFVDRYGALHDSRQDDMEIRQRLGAFSVICAHGHILLTCPPWAPTWAELPGGGVRAGETVEQASLRELEEETQLRFAGEDLPTPVKADMYYMNLHAEDVSRHLRYTQIFYFYDLGNIMPDSLFAPRTSEEGSVGFWHPVEALETLPDGVNGLRVGHEHIIREATQHECKPDKIQSRDMILKSAADGRFAQMKDAYNQKGHRPFSVAGGREGTQFKNACRTHAGGHSGVESPVRFVL